MSDELLSFKNLLEINGYEFTFDGLCSRCKG